MLRACPLKIGVKYRRNFQGFRACVSPFLRLVRAPSIVAQNFSMRAWTVCECYATRYWKWISPQVEGPKMVRVLAIWATWVPVGRLITFLAAPHLVRDTTILPLMLVEWAMEAFAAFLIWRTSNPAALAPSTPDAASAG